MNQTHSHTETSVNADAFLSLKKQARHFLFQGEYEKAESCMEQALALEPGAADILYLKGQSAHSCEDYLGAIAHYKESLNGAEMFETYKALSIALIGGRDIQGALKALEDATKKFGWDYESVTTAAIAYIFTGDHQRSMDFLIKAITREPARLAAKVYFGHLMQVGYTPDYNEQIKAAVLECLKDVRVDHSYFARIWAQQITGDPEAAALRDMISMKDYASFVAAFSQPKNRRYMQESFFIYGVERLTLHKPAFEKFIAHIRRYYLDMVHEGDELHAGDFTLLCAVAANCHLHEYVAPVSEHESAILKQIYSGLEKETGIYQPEDLAIAAAYNSLNNINFQTPPQNYSALMRHRVEALIRRQIMEPLTEKNIRKNLPRLVPIEDKTSKAVQDMYEENPYPRWLYTGTHASLDPEFARGKGMKILIAGCGTGKQAVHVAAAWPHAEILAIDLSAASIAYAARKVQEYGYDNITFKQGDILKLADVLEAGTFDRVESTGVLHHMKDPLAGWTVLTKLLKPGGKMTIGLYSRLSRIEIDKARQMIKDKGYEPNRANIQKFRQYIMALPDTDPLYSLNSWQDIYSLSNCRDLLFHVQERNYSLQEIRENLDTLGLKFAGFKKWPHAYLKLYKERYPNDPEMINLDHWHTLEIENPDMFATHNIYLFYVEKPLK